MKLNYKDYLNREFISDFSKHIERFELHKIENEIIFFWQPKQGVIQEFENSGTSFESYLEILLDSYKLEFGHGYLDPNLDFRQGIDFHYHLTPEEIQSVYDVENGPDRIHISEDVEVWRYDVFDQILSDKRNAENMKKAVELIRQKQVNNKKLTYAEKEVLRIQNSIDELDAFTIAMGEQSKNPVFISQEESEKLLNTPHISIDLKNHQLGTLDGVKHYKPKK
jgi:hypothetical protein